MNGRNAQKKWQKWRSILKEPSAQELDLYDANYDFPPGTQANKPASGGFTLGSQEPEMEPMPGFQWDEGGVESRPVDPDLQVRPTSEEDLARHYPQGDYGDMFDRSMAPGDVYGELGLPYVPEEPERPVITDDMTYGQARKQARMHGISHFDWRGQSRGTRGATEDVIQWVTSLRNNAQKSGVAAKIRPSVLKKYKRKLGSAISVAEPEELPPLSPLDVIGKINQPRTIPGMGGLKGPSISGVGGDLDIERMPGSGKLDRAFDQIEQDEKSEKNLLRATSFERFKDVALKYWLPEDTPPEDLRFLYNDLLKTDGRRNLLNLMSDPSRNDDKVGYLLRKLRVGEGPGRGIEAGRLPPVPRRKDTSNSLASIQEEILRETSPVIKEE